MWSAFMVPDEEGRQTGMSSSSTGALAGMLGARSKRRGRVASPALAALSKSQEGKIKLAFLVATVGITLTMLGVGTEFWLELSPPKGFSSNQTCVAAHYGLWKYCTKVLWIANADSEQENCRSLHLPGESNCSYFKFYTTGENTVIFQKTPDKNLTIASAMLAIFSLFLMVMGAVCIIMALSKATQFFLKLGSAFFTLSGVLVFLSLIVFHQSVLSFLASDHSIAVHHELSWSVMCVGCAGVSLVVAAVLFFLLALPYRP